MKYKTKSIIVKFLISFLLVLMILPTSYEIENKIIYSTYRKSYAAEPYKSGNFRHDFFDRGKIDKRFGRYNFAVTFYFYFDTSEPHFMYLNHYQIEDYTFTFQCNQDIFVYYFGEVYGLKEAYENKILNIWNIKTIHRKYTRYLENRDQDSFLV